MAATLKDLREELKSYNFDVLTKQDDAVATRALEKATLWAKAKIEMTGAAFDPDLPIVREIVLKRALYELYSYAENEQVASDKKEDAMELLKAAYGPSVDGTGYSSGAGSVSTGIAVGTMLGDERDHQRNL